MPQTRVDSGVMFLPIRELARRIRARELSPVDLTELSLARLEQLGPRYNAVVTLMRESALAEAALAEKEIAAGTGLSHEAVRQRYHRAVRAMAENFKSLLQDSRPSK